MRVWLFAIVAACAGSVMAVSGQQSEHVTLEMLLERVRLVSRILHRRILERRR